MHAIAIAIGCPSEGDSIAQAQQTLVTGHEETKSMLNRKLPAE